MSTAHDSAASSQSSPLGTLFDRHHLLLRRLHSLSGILPVGIFVIFHLFTNFQMVMGDFQHEVDFIHNMPALLIIELALWGGIGFHAALGVVYTFTGRSNVKHYKYADNWRYTLQRVTGIIALLFIFFHISTLRWGWTYGGLWITPFFTEGPEGKELAFLSTAYALQYGPMNGLLISVLYLIGGLSVVYHWANGLWTAAITWGLTITEASMKRWGYACAVLAIVLTIFTVGSVWKPAAHKFTSEERALVEEAIRRYQAGESMEEPMTHRTPDADQPVARVD